jgi:transcriptional regulator with GAF, ATPase, and Fis domain
MRRVKDQLPAIAASQGTVLITGESGTGKEVVARALHELSPRGASPYLAVNCAALSESLLESELFGHERGAFTGAEKLRKGRFELAHGGTLLLDEVSEVSPQIQAKLLRVLQERAFERVGSSVTIGVDVRVVATSNRDLPRAAADGEFRQDLFFRLNVLPVLLPPLRERREDVPALVRHFARTVCHREGRAEIRFEDAAVELLMAYHWPGNVRELANICERAAVLAGATGAPLVRRDLLEPWLLPAGVGLPGGSAAGATATTASGARKAMPLHRPEAASTIEARPIAGERTLEEIERDTIVRTLERFNGHRAKTARALGIGVRTLGLKLKKWKELELVSPNL